MKPCTRPGQLRAVNLLLGVSLILSAGIATASATPPGDDGARREPSSTATPAGKAADAWNGTQVALLQEIEDLPESRPTAHRKMPAFVTPPPRPPWRVVFNNGFFLRWNPIGLEDQLRAGAERRLFVSDKPISRDNFFFFGLFPRLNPAFVKIGPGIEIQPLSIFNLRVVAEFINYFSSFGFLQSFQSPLVDYSDRTMGLRTDFGQNYVTYGAHVYIEPTLQFKFGPVVVRNKFAIEYWRMRLRNNDRVWYEITLDTLISGNGWVLNNDLDVLWLSKFGLAAGVRYSAVRPLYRPGDFAPGDVRQNLNDHQRVGPLVAYTFYDHGYTRFNRPTLVLVLNWYVDHRWRTGADVSPAVPYLVLGFAFQSDILK